MIAVSDRPLHVPTTWGAALLPAGVLSALLALLLGLLLMVLNPVRGSAGEVLFWTWPWFFGAAALISFVLAFVLRQADASLLGARLSRREATALALSILAGVGFAVGLVVTLFVHVKPGLDSEAQSLAYLAVGLLIGVLLGAIAAPMAVNTLLARMRVASILVVIADAILFIAGALGVFLLWREGLVRTELGAPVLVFGALLFSPIGMWLSHQLLFRR